MFRRYLPEYTVILIHIHRTEPDIVSGFEEELRLLIGTEQPQGCPAYKLPSTGALQGVDACLVAGNTH